MWVIFLLIGLIALIILLLSVPLDLILSVDTTENTKLKIKLAWFFGLISKELSSKEKKTVAREKKRKFDFRVILKILQTKGLVKQFKVLITSTLVQFNIRKFVTDIKLGFDDPADYGLVYALIGSVTPFVNLSPKYQIRLQPNFNDESTFDGYLHGILRLQPVKLVIPVLRFVFSLTMLRIIKTYISSKWKRKK